MMSNTEVPLDIEADDHTADDPTDPDPDPDPGVQVEAKKDAVVSNVCQYKNVAIFRPVEV